MYKITYGERDKKRTYPITFRLPEVLVDDLRKESEGMHISLNNLVNQVFERYISWDRHSYKLGLVPTTRQFIKEVLKELSDEKIRAIASNASKEALKELILLSKGKCDLDYFVSIFNEWLNVSSLVYRYEQTVSFHKYVIQHDMERKWSLYLAELLSAICRDLTGAKAQFTVSSSIVSVSFEVDI
jgi:hypothetical protein